MSRHDPAVTLQQMIEYAEDAVRFGIGVLHRTGVTAAGAKNACGRATSRLMDPWLLVDVVTGVRNGWRASPIDATQSLHVITNINGQLAIGAGHPPQHRRGGRCTRR